MPLHDGQDLFACTVDESAGLADRCPGCGWPAWRVRDCACIRRAQPLSFCTSSEDCTADVADHLESCPVEQQLRETFGY